MAFSANDEQAASFAHSLGFALDFRFIFCNQLVKALAGSQNISILGVGMAVALGHQHFNFCFIGCVRGRGDGQALCLGAGFGVLVFVLQHFQVGIHLAGQLFAQGGLCHIGHVAAQHDIGAAASHIGGDGHSALLTGLCNDFGFALMLLCVQHIVLNAALFQQLGKRLALFHADGTNQNGLALGVAFGNLLDHGIILAVDGLVHAVRQVLAGAGLVGGDGYDLQAVNFAELVRFGGSRTGHAAQLFVHAEIVLEGDAGQSLALSSNGHAFLGFNGLVQTVIEAAAIHQTAGEFINDDDLAVFHDIVGITVHHTAGLDGTVNIVAQGHVVGIGQVLNIEPCFGFLNAAFGQGAGLVLFVHNVITVNLFIGFHFVVQFNDDRLFQRFGKVVRALVHHAGIFALAGDDQRGTGFINQDGVHLVHDGVSMAALHHAGLVNHHVVTQVVKAKLVVGAVSNIRQVSLAAVLRLYVMDNQADRQAKKAVNLAHPFAVALGQVIVDGNNMHAFAGQGIQVNGHGGHQGLAFTGLHLGNAGTMKHNAADDLHRVGLQAQHTPVRFAADGERFGQDIVKAGPVFQLFFQVRGFGL